jgi:hypothetical protein
MAVLPNGYDERGSAIPWPWLPSSIRMNGLRYGNIGRIHCGPMRRSILFIASTLIFAVGCDTSDRLARLEKQNQELQVAVKGQQAVTDYDLQAKCSKDARAWFNENWSRDKDTILLDFTNHYNKTQNKCLVLVEYHYSSAAGPNATLWTNDMTLTDVYENVKMASFGENHYTYFKPTINTSDNVIICEVLSQKCKSIDEFNTLLAPYLSN